MRLIVSERRCDERDLAILALAAADFDVGAIARQLCVSQRLVQRVLDADAEEYPDEPVRAVAI